MISDLTPERRLLPAGHRDETSLFFIPRPLRSFYQTVTVPDEHEIPGSTLSKHLLVLDLVCEWIVRDQSGWALDEIPE